MNVAKSLATRTSVILLAPWRGISRVALAIFVLSTIFNTLFLSQGVDVNHTVISSYAYLKGHVFDFYDYNSGIVVRNDYLPLIYLIFAAWMTPFAIAHKMPNEAVSQALILSPWEILWAKVLILLVFIVSFYLLWKISKVILANSSVQQHTVVWAFLFSPFAAYAVTAFTQYDIIGICLALGGIYAYLRNKTLLFLVLFSLAISLKFFALIVFIPLILLRYKQLWKIVAMVIAGLSISLLQILLYLPNQAFAANFLVLAERKTGESTTNWFSIIVLLVAVAGCVYLWRFKEPEQNQGLVLALSSATAYGLFFEAATWHPQWIILIVPYFALATGFLKQPAYFLLYEILGFLAFIWITVNGFVFNADAIMLERGPLQSLLPVHTFAMAEIFPTSLLWLANLVFGVYLVTPLFFWLIGRNRSAIVRDGVIPQWVWVLRALSFPAIFTLPAIMTLI